MSRSHGLHLCRYPAAVRTYCSSLTSTLLTRHLLSTTSTTMVLQPKKKNNFLVDTPNQSTMSRLELLSSEIISEIIRYLSGRSITSISLCSRRLHDITEPILYSNIHLNRPHSYPSFIRTIVASPHLIGCVKHFRTSGKKTPPSPLSQDKISN